MQTTTETTWILVTFVLLLAFANHTAIGSVGLVWGSAMFLQIPFELMGAMMDAFPLLAPLFLLALLYYFIVILPAGVGEGYTLFIVAAVIILMVGI
ncbi:hypothetical protein HY994_01055 [Candidatus Micrarchaeota archaeon]|nr:hypothetical protein [Candidatus Micrarchaeota archaeon]